MNMGYVLQQWGSIFHGCILQRVCVKKLCVFKSNMSNKKASDNVLAQRATRSNTTVRSQEEAAGTGSGTGLQQNRQPKKDNRTEHPPPMHKTARKLLYRIQEMGYRNFNDLPFLYWEPHHPGEIDSAYRSRRQKERFAMDRFLKKNDAVFPRDGEEAEMESGDDGDEETHETSVLETMDAEVEVLSEKLKQQAAKNRLLETVLETEKAERQNLEKELAILKSGEQKGLKSPTDTPPEAQMYQAQIDELSAKVADLLEELRLERDARLNAEKVLSQVTQTVATLEEELRQAKIQQSNPTSPEAIKGLVESLLGPALKSLTAQNPQEKSPKPAPITQASSSNGMYSQVVKKGGQTQRSKSSGNYTPESDPASTPPEAVKVTKPEDIPGEAPSSTPLNAPMEQAPEFSVSRAEKRKKARQVARERKKHQKEEERKKEDNDAKTKAERERKKAEKKKRLPSSVKHNPATLLLLPDKDTPNVLQKLQNMPQADPRQLGIKRHVVFPSGALLVTCGSAEQASQLRNITGTAGIQEKTRTEKAPEFRIHQIPKNTTSEHIQADLERRFPGIKARVNLHPYRCEKFKDLQFAVVQTNLADLKKVSKVRSIRVGWTTCQLDTRIHVTRCLNCGLLGHSEKKCDRMEAQSEDTANHPEGECRDCHHHNKLQQEASKATGVKGNTRAVVHQTGSSQCPTLIALKKKALPTRPTSAGAATKE